MGPLLDPKLFPAKVAASPETATSHYDQPNAFLDKLQAKHPMLYSILQNEASPELKQRIDRDRNKTTYMVDFCESGKQPLNFSQVDFTNFTSQQQETSTINSFSNGEKLLQQNVCCSTYWVVLIL